MDFDYLIIKLQILTIIKGYVMIYLKFLLINKNNYTSSVLVENLFQRGFKNIKNVSKS